MCQDSIQQQDCSCCVSCRDKPKFGGPETWKEENMSTGVLYKNSVKHG